MKKTGKSRQKQPQSQETKQPKGVIALTDQELDQVQGGVASFTSQEFVVTKDSHSIVSPR